MSQRTDMVSAYADTVPRRPDFVSAYKYSVPSRDDSVPGGANFMSARRDRMSGLIYQLSGNFVPAEYDFWSELWVLRN